MLQTILNLLGKFGNVMDLPGSSVRDLITGNNPFDQWMTPTEEVNRVSGRDVLSQFGLMRPNHETGMSGWLSDPGEGVRDVGGALFEGLLDPINLLPANWVGKALKSRKAAAAANAAIGGKYGYVNPKVAARPAAEVVSEVASSPMKLLGYTPEPELVYHGGHKWTNVSDTHPYGKPVINSGKVGEGRQLFGPGHYVSQSPEVVRKYRDMAVKKVYESDEAFADAFKPGSVVPISEHSRILVRTADPVSRKVLGKQQVRTGDRWDDLTENGEVSVPKHGTYVRKTLGEKYGSDRTAVYGSTLPEGTVDRLFDHNAIDGGDYVAGVPDHPLASLTRDVRGAADEVRSAFHSVNNRKLWFQNLRAEYFNANQNGDWYERAMQAIDSGDRSAFRTAMAGIDAPSPFNQIVDPVINMLSVKRDQLESVLSQLQSHPAFSAGEVSNPFFRTTGVGDSEDAVVADVLHLIESGVPGAKNNSTHKVGVRNLNIWDQNVLDQMKVREINGEKVPWNLMLPIQQQPTTRVMPAPESPLTPTMAQRQVPLSLRSPLAAGFMYNMLARQRGEL